MRLRVKEEESLFVKILTNIIGLCALTFLGYSFYQDHQKLVAAQHWVPIQAIIKSENFYVSEAVHGRSPSPREDCLMGYATYAFKGFSYGKSFFVDCKDSDSKESDNQVTQQLGQSYPINSKISIRFNPQQPEQSMTTTEFNILSSSDNSFKKFLEIYGISAILFVVLGFILFFYLKGGKKPPSIFDYEP